MSSPSQFDTITVLGFDPGLAHFGWCVAELSTVFPPQICRMGVWKTVKAAERSNVRASADMGRRAAELYESLAELVNAHRPAAFLLEAFSAARNATNAAKTARAFGIVDAIAAATRTPMFEVSPQALKKATAGSTKASKAEVEAAIRPLCTIDALATLPRAKGVHEHIFDAGGAVVAGAQLPEFRMVWSMMGRGRA